MSDHELDIRQIEGLRGEIGILVGHPIGIPIGRSATLAAFGIQGATEKSYAQAFNDRSVSATVSKQVVLGSPYWKGASLGLFP